MAAAAVEARIKRGDGGKIIADVHCKFDMRCSTQAGENSGMSFPLYYADQFSDEAIPEETGFTVAIDGKAPASVKKDTWAAIDEKGKQRTQHGYTWPVQFTKGQKRRISVHYSLVLPKENSKFRFLYFLRSGALWNGDIGAETVRVIAEKGLKLEALTSTGLEPSRKTDSELVWSIKDAKPIEDIRVAVSPAGNP